MLQKKLDDFVTLFTLALVSETFFFQQATITTHNRHCDTCGISPCILTFTALRFKHGWFLVRVVFLLMHTEHRLTLTRVWNDVNCTFASVDLKMPGFVFSWGLSFKPHWSGMDCGNCSKMTSSWKYPLAMEGEWHTLNLNLFSSRFILDVAGKRCTGDDWTFLWRKSHWVILPGNNSTQTVKTLWRGKG